MTPHEPGENDVVVADEVLNQQRQLLFSWPSETARRILELCGMCVSPWKTRVAGLLGAEDSPHALQKCLYFLLLKATITSFSGLGSLPVIRDDLVVKRNFLTDEQLNTAIVVTRTTPGPVGLYVVSVGYFADGFPGAVAGWLAMITPAILIIPLIHYWGKRAEHPRVKAVLRAVVLSSAGLLWSATLPIARTAVRDPVTLLILILSVAVLLTRKVDSLWVILAAALVQLAAASFHFVSGL